MHGLRYIQGSAAEWMKYIPKHQIPKLLDLINIKMVAYVKRNEHILNISIPYSGFLSQTLSNT